MYHIWSHTIVCDFLWLHGSTSNHTSNFTGMEWRHNDLRVNYVSIQDTSVRNKCERFNFTMQDQNASFDFVHFDLDPTPDYIDGELQAHGTQCSGIVGMANSSVCGIGVAHQANIGGRLILLHPLSIIIDSLQNFQITLSLRTEV